MQIGSTETLNTHVTTLQNLKSEAADGVSPPSCTYMFLVLQITRDSRSAGSTGIPELVRDLLDNGCSQDWQEKDGSGQFHGGFLGKESFLMKGCQLQEPCCPKRYLLHYKRAFP